MTNYLTRYDPFGEMLSLRSAMDRDVPERLRLGRRSGPGDG